MTPYHQRRPRTTIRLVTLAASSAILLSASPAAGAAHIPGGLLPDEPAAAPPVVPPSPWLEPPARDLIATGLQIGASTLDLTGASALAATTAPQPFALADCDTGACTVSTGGTVTAGARRFRVARRELTVGAAATRQLLLTLPGRALAARQPGEALRLRLTITTVAGSSHRGRTVVPLTIR